MNLKRLKAFCAIVETGTASAAAEQLHIAPTAISMQIAQLEESLGGKLFNRDTRPMRLTTLGEYLHPRAMELLATARQVEKEAQGVAAGNLGWLSIGFVRSTIFSVLPGAVRQMRQAFPQVRIDLVEMLSEHQAQSIRKGVIHVGLSRQMGDYAREPDMRYTVLMRDPLVAAVPAYHPLATRETVSPAELDALPFICFPKDPFSSFSKQSIEYLQGAGGRPDIGYEAKEIHTALGLVAAGLGMTLVGRTVAQNNRSDVRFLAIDAPPMETEIFALSAQGEPHPLVERFLSFLLPSPA
jgi:LysR family transcriptional regulator, benzoate and cis,cis-muconate-responsive activator of ben and cat genes